MLANGTAITILAPSATLVVLTNAGAGAFAAMVVVASVNALLSQFWFRRCRFAGHC